MLVFGGVIIHDIYIYIYLAKINRNKLRIYSWFAWWLQYFFVPDFHIFKLPVVLFCVGPLWEAGHKKPVSTAAKMPTPGVISRGESRMGSSEWKDGILRMAIVIIPNLEDPPSATVRIVRTIPPLNWSFQPMVCHRIWKGSHNPRSWGRCWSPSGYQSLATLGWSSFRTGQYPPLQLTATDPWK